MKAILRRLHRLKDQFGSPGETEYDLWLRQRLEAAHRRIAEARKRGELPPAEEERPLTELEQRRLEILKQAAWHAKLQADRRAKM
jgi:shikimate kinase